MIIHYQTFVEKQLLIVKYEGLFCIDRYKQHVLYMTETPEWKSVNKNLVDLRSIVSTKFKMEDIITLVDINKNIIKKEIVSVQLVDKPMVTALSHLIQAEFSEYNFKSDYCSTINKAIELLHVDFKEKDLIDKLDSLEHTF